MRSLRSTERTFNLLLASKNVKSQSRAYGRKTFDYLLKSDNGRKSNVPFNQARNRIKLKEVSQRQLFSTAPPPPELVPLLNPNKPDPEATKELVAVPIRPLTMPRFAKNTSNDLPSVTKILQATMPAASQFILDRWKASMIKKLGIAGFNKYQTETFERGRILHALLANYLMGLGDPVDNQSVELSKDIVSNLWKSIEKVVKDKITNVRLVEHIVTHADMKYRGIVDCVAFYENELVVIDFKTAEKPKKNVESLYDNPLQVTAYCGAINNDSQIPKHVIDRNICAGLVIVAYIDGSEASTYYLGRDKLVNDYWKQWTMRLGQYSQMEELKKKRTLQNKNHMNL